MTVVWGLRGIGLLVLWTAELCTNNVLIQKKQCQPKFGYRHTVL